MKLEQGFVDRQLKKHLDHNGNLSANLEALKKSIYTLIVKFATESEDSEEDFQLSKNLLVILDEIIASSDTRAFHDWESRFSDKALVDAVEKLYSLKSDPSCCAVMLGVRSEFSGQCLSLAAWYEGAVIDNLLIFTRDGTAAAGLDTSKLNTLKKDLADAEENFKQVSEFCVQHMRPLKLG